MKYLILIVTSLLIVTTSYSQSDKRLKGIEKELNKILEETKVAGFSVAVVEKDKVLYTKGFGYRDVDNKIVVDENTLFAIGSCTKAFTSAILGQLADNDQLSFDDNPRDYLTDLKFYNDEINSNVTIKDMMCHMTGVPRHDGSWYLFPSDDRTELIKRIEYHQPFTGLRQKWYYNNFMFMAQGAIAEEITGKSWDQNIQDRFFKPLGMNRSNTSIAELEKASNAALGYSVKGDSALILEDYYKIAGMSPAGSINSSALEMANWVITWINNGKFGDNEIIPEWYVNEAMSSQAVVNGSLPDAEFPDIFMRNYGYAWGMGSYKGHYMVEHGGAIDGFRASTSFFPSDSIGIIVLVNSGGTPATSLIRKTVADRMLKVERTNWVDRYMEKKAEAKERSKSEEEAKEEQEVKPMSAHELVDFVGEYYHPGYGRFEIEIENDSLFAIFKLDRFYVGNRHFDVFDVYDIVDGKPDMESAGAPLNFKTNDSGDISSASLKIEPSIDDPIEFKKEVSAIEVDESQLEKYVGDFAISGITVQFYLKDGVFYTYVPGQPEYELVPTAKHKFSFKDLEGFKVEFIEETNGRIDSVKLIQPNGTFVANRKQE
jgi:CubicO group peptidase (beta-lactamase class C family)